MAIKRREDLYTRFETGDRPTQQDFWDLLDSVYINGQDDELINNKLNTIINPTYTRQQIDSHIESTTDAHGGIVAYNDPRLTNNRNPVAHHHEPSDVETNASFQFISSTEKSNIASHLSATTEAHGGIVSSTQYAIDKATFALKTDVVDGAVTIGNIGDYIITDHTSLSSIGTNTHAQIDTFIATGKELPLGNPDVDGKVLSSTTLGVRTWVTAGGAGVSFTDDTTTNSTYYPAMATAVDGTTLKIASSKLNFNPSTGTLYSTIFNSSSDERLKKNIAPIANAVDTISSLNGVSFTWKESNKDCYGVIAQELETVLPELVSEDSEGIKSVNYDALIGILIESIKELKSEIEIFKR